MRFHYRHTYTNPLCSEAGSVLLQDAQWLRKNVNQQKCFLLHPVKENALRTQASAKTIIPGCRRWPRSQRAFIHLLNSETPLTTPVFYLVRLVSSFATAGQRFLATVGLFGGIFPQTFFQALWVSLGSPGKVYFNYRNRHERAETYSSLL